jgi:hypothetical protein
MNEINKKLSEGFRQIINKEEYSSEVKKATQEIQNYARKTNIDIFELGGVFDNIENKVQFGLNWSAKGTVKLQDAENFSKDIQEGISIIKKYNNKFKIKEWTGLV